MALKAIVNTDEHGALGEDIKAEYTEQDGMFYLDVTPVTVGRSHYALEDITGLKTALGKEKANAKTFKVKLDAFEDLDPEAAREALAKMEEIADWKPDKKVQEQLDAVKTQLEKKYGKDVGTLTDERDYLMKQLKYALISSDAAAAVAKHGVKKAYQELIKMKLENDAFIEKADNGDFAVRIRGEDGSARISMNGEGYMSIDERASSIAGNEEYAGAFEGPGTAGSGLRGSDVAGTTRTTKLTHEQAGDFKSYVAAKARAEKEGKDIRTMLPTDIGT